MPVELARKWGSSKLEPHFRANSTDMMRSKLVQARHDIPSLYTVRKGFVDNQGTLKNPSDARRANEILDFSSVRTLFVLQHYPRNPYGQCTSPFLRHLQPPSRYSQITPPCQTVSTQDQCA